MRQAVYETDMGALSKTGLRRLHGKGLIPKARTRLCEPVSVYNRESTSLKIARERVLLVANDRNCAVHPAKLPNAPKERGVYQSGGCARTELG